MLRHYKYRKEPILEYKKSILYREADPLTVISKDPKSLCISPQQKASTTLDVRICRENALTSITEAPDARSFVIDACRIDGSLQGQCIPAFLRSDVRIQLQYVDEADFDLLKFQKTESPTCLTDLLISIHFFNVLTGQSFKVASEKVQSFLRQRKQPNRHCVKLNFI
ncbi:MAG: hypothetical protein EZS28_050326, partial [Streblomastix strix]